MGKRRFKVINGGRQWSKPSAYGVKTPPKPPSSWRRFVPLYIASIALGGIVGAGFLMPGQLAPVQANPEPLAAASSSGGERVKFGSCHIGGGTNCVVDGDTFYMHGQKIRIAGYDAPETHDFKCASEKALGDRATARLKELLNSGPVSLSSIDRDEDVYGRKLRNVAVNGADVGGTLISEGLAREYRGYKMGWC